MEVNGGEVESQPLNNGDTFVDIWDVMYKSFAEPFAIVSQTAFQEKFMNK